MTVQSFKMGPGTLKLGTAGVFDASCQVRAFTVEASENVEEEDPIPVLCGEEVLEDEEVSLDWTATGTILQDLASAGVVAYTWSNASTWVDFEFVPNTAAARKITGEVRLIPLSAGGDVKSRPTSDFTWVARGPGGAGTAPAGGRRMTAMSSSTTTEAAGPVEVYDATLGRVLVVVEDRELGNAIKRSAPDGHTVSVRKARTEPEE